MAKNWGPNWADEHIAALRRGETVSFRPHGRSMEPRIVSDQLCTVDPIQPRNGPRIPIEVDDVVLCLVGKRQYLHFVKQKGPLGALLIGNAKGGVNGWVHASAVYGKLVKVEA